MTIHTQPPHKTQPDDAAIARYLAEHGATRCPAKPAMLIGETSPGWRRDLERRRMKAGKREFFRHQRTLKRRLMPESPTHYGAWAEGTPDRTATQGQSRTRR